MKNKLLFSVFVYFIILVLLSLGFWQLYRLSWKLDLINQIENSLKIDPVELKNVEKKNYLRIKTSGQIDFEKQIYLYNLNETGKPGFEVINPIKVGNEDYLINRGWISFDKKNIPPQANNIILDISNQRQKQYSDETWNYLYELSLETFVEESEEKKLSGAGAGLTDND